MASTSTRTTPKKCQNNIEETKQNKSMKRSPECANTSPSPKVQQGVTNINVEDVDDENICSSDGFITPKGRRFKIPKVHYDNCPPAPMQRK
ncbi:hypothetical protein MTR_7g091750 [Medicago truncatula]|uniref:Uncharacterized protein n=1 Tax=Medicago truncatula TaxID=3880 RepID=A0A072UCR8_MEDTR|nr:hypothetical protein MTR_7g091750 [Medicago truncatula]